MGKRKRIKTADLKNSLQKLKKLIDDILLVYRDDIQEKDAVKLLQMLKDVVIMLDKYKELNVDLGQ